MYCVSVPSLPAADCSTPSTWNTEAPVSTGSATTNRNTKAVAPSSSHTAKQIQAVARAPATLRGFVACLACAPV